MGRDLSKKEIIIEVSSQQEAKEAVARGATSLYGPDSILPEDLKDRIKVYSEGRDVVRARVRTQEDIEVIDRLPLSEGQALLVETEDMKIIPLENVVARLQRSGARLLARINSVDEAESILGVLERGVDGVVYKPKEMGEVSVLNDLLNYLRSVELKTARVTEVINVGMGERACVDTTSMLRLGEGLLVGNMSRMLFLVHNESIGSKFTAPRPFRINAGAIHMYTLTPSGTTNYLSELRAGKRVLIASHDGSTRVASIGRVKIERRPLVMVAAEVGDMRGSVILQNAETIRLVSPKGEPKDVTSIGIGDEVLVWTSRKSARHLGMEVEEFLDEV